MTKVTYRLFEAKDIHQLVELGIKLHEELTNQKAGFEKNYLESSTAFFQSGLDHQNYLSAVTEVDGKIVSTGGICVYNTPPIPPKHQGRVGFLTNFYTLPEYRKCGFSKNVLIMLMEKSKELRLIRLHMGQLIKV